MDYKGIHLKYTFINSLKKGAIILLIILEIFEKQFLPAYLSILPMSSNTRF